jgi:hypothetical protein
MIDSPEESPVLEDTLAQGIAAVMAADEELSLPEDMADLFLEELNRLWSEPEPLVFS